MSYSLLTHPDYDGELRKQALDYQDQFSTGINDFLDAIHDTYDRIIPFPFSNPMIEEFGDPTIRGVQVQAHTRSKNYAKDFPFKLIYKIYGNRKRVVIYQLWPESSLQKIKKLD